MEKYLSYSEEYRDFYLYIDEIYRVEITHYAVNSSSNGNNVESLGNWLRLPRFLNHFLQPVTKFMSHKNL